MFNKTYSSLWKHSIVSSRQLQLLFCLSRFHRNCPIFFKNRCYSSNAIEWKQKRNLKWRDFRILHYSWQATFLLAVETIDEMQRSITLGIFHSVLQDKRKAKCGWSGDTELTSINLLFLIFFYILLEWTFCLDAIMRRKL